jgi:hypothetical protein
MILGDYKCDKSVAGITKAQKVGIYATKLFTNDQILRFGRILPSISVYSKFLGKKTR